MEEKNDRLSQETPVEATDDAVLERLWANQPGAVSWKKKSPFGQPVSAAVPVSPTAPATPAAPQAEAVPEPPAPVEAAPPAPVTPPVESVLQTVPPVVEEPQPPVEAIGEEKEPWPLEDATVSWKRKSPFGQPVPAAVPVSPTARQPRRHRRRKRSRSRRPKWKQHPLRRSRRRWKLSCRRHPLWWKHRSPRRCSRRNLL